MLRTHVDPESFRREWMAISDDDSDFSCVAELDGEIVGLGFLDVTDSMDQPGLPQRTQSNFCDPASPWQHGSNENTNGLLRQYFPKGTDLNAHSAQRLLEVATELNHWTQDAGYLL
jgi:hypothetical protein